MTEEPKDSVEVEKGAAAAKAASVEKRRQAAEKRKQAKAKREQAKTGTDENKKREAEEEAAKLEREATLLEMQAKLQAAIGVFEEATGKEFDPGNEFHVWLLLDIIEELEITGEFSVPGSTVAADFPTRASGRGIPVSVDPSVSTNFQWELVEGAAGYELQIAGVSDDMGLAQAAQAAPAPVARKEDPPDATKITARRGTITTGGMLIRGVDGAVKPGATVVVKDKNGKKSKEIKANNRGGFVIRESDLPDGFEHRRGKKLDVSQKTAGKSESDAVEVVIK